MRYLFLVDTYATERVKVVSVWSEFRDRDLALRPKQDDRRGRSVHEQMVHQCVSEDLWSRNMLGIDVSAPPLPREETRLEFIAAISRTAENAWPPCSAKMKAGGRAIRLSSTWDDPARGS